MLANARVADGDGHQCAMLDGAAHGGLQGCGLGAAQPQFPPQLTQRAAAALMRAVQLDHRVALGIARIAAERTSGPGPAGRTTVSRDHDESAFGHRAHRAVQRHLERGSADDQHHQRADEPPDRQAHQRAGRDDGADHEVDRHERQQQRPPPMPPARGQPRARHGQHRRQHRDPPRVVEELRRAPC